MNPQPGLHIGSSGSPNTFLTNALPMPGAMMNHFVIANWYDESSDNTLGSQVLRATSQVKIMKYYAGAEITGTVEMKDSGQSLDNVRILVERDAFSGEDETDLDSDTYWIPNGTLRQTRKRSSKIIRMLRSDDDTLDKLGWFFDADHQ